MRELVHTPCEAAVASNALKTTSATLCDVSVFPELTATCSEGQRIVPAGMRTSAGARHPAFRGMSMPIRHRRQYKMADLATAGGVLRLCRPSGPVPSKSNIAPPSSGFMVIFSAIGCTQCQPCPKTRLCMTYCSIVHVIDGL